tara:strand:+ start:7481 stop:8347 length:867 start_codon:yes stop_codon:yes gene_type:complete
MNQTINLPSGDIAALTYGDKTKPPMLMLHGWLDNAASFAFLAPLLAEDYYVVAIDLPGHGDSTHLADTSDYQQIQTVETIIEVLDALGWEQCDLVGHSLGGAIGVLVAASFPERIKHFVSIDAIGPMSETAANSPGRLARSVKRIVKASQQPERTYPDKDAMIKARMKANGFTAEEALPIVNRSAKETDEGYVWRFDKKLLLPSLIYFTEDQVRAFLGAISMPMLIIEATHGILHKHPLIEERKQCIPNLTVEVLEGHHHIHLQQPEVVAGLIRAFLIKNGDTKPSAT